MHRRQGEGHGRAKPYADGATQAFSLGAPDWYGAPQSGAEAAVVAPYQNRPGNQQLDVPATIYFSAASLADKAVRSVELPNVSAQPAPNVPTLHVFAIAIGG